MAETGLYLPVKAFLERLGYVVKGEVKGCDVVAVKPDVPDVVVVTELKQSLTLELLLQAADRLSIADEVWIAVPATRRGRDQDRRAHRLCRLIGLGLLTVNLRHGTVEVLADPGPYAPRRNARRRSALVSEFQRRRGDPELGGSNRKKLMTAYRQLALDCALALLDGERRSMELRASLPDATKVLYRNVYGWFERVGTGRYRLTQAGEAAARAWVAETTPAGLGSAAISGERDDGISGADR